MKINVDKCKVCNTYTDDLVNGICVSCEELETTEDELSSQTYEPLEELMSYAKEKEEEEGYVDPHCKCSYCYDPRGDEDLMDEFLSSAWTLQGDL